MRSTSWSTGATSWRSTATPSIPTNGLLVIDDVLATGGTASATARLVTGLGGVIVGLGFLIELADLGGRDRLTGYDVAILARM